MIWRKDCRTLASLSVDLMKRASDVPESPRVTRSVEVNQSKDKAAGAGCICRLTISMEMILRGVKASTESRQTL